MPQIDEALARISLLAGALGIGEDHTKGNARELALALINSSNHAGGRLVTNFFTELYEDHGNIEKLASARILAANGAALGLVEEAAPTGFLYGNPIPQGRVIARALQRGIPVHLADITAMQSGRMHKKRHTAILNRFRAVTGQPPPGLAQAVGPPACVGCLLLWGGAHFEGADALDQFIHGLPFVKMG